MQSNNNQSVRRFYVYGHYTNNDELFYIGVGTILNLSTKKLISKYARAYHFQNRNNFWKNIASKHGIKVKILHEFYTKEETLLKEKELVSKYGRRWKKEGVLSNISSGGEIGPINRCFKMSEEQKKKLSDVKSMMFYIYNAEGKYLISIKTIKSTAKYCGVTYNAIHSCLQTKNFTNSFFVFKEYKGESLPFTSKDLNFKSTLSKRIISEDLLKNKIEHESIYDCSRYLSCSRESVRDALHRGGTCKKHKIYLKDNQQPRS